MLANFIDEQCLCYRHYSEAFFTVASNLEVMKTAVASTVALRDRAEKGYEGRVSAQDDFTDEALPAAAAVADAAAALAGATAT